MIPLSVGSNQSFRTPKWLREQLCLRRYDLDAAATECNRVCERWYGPGGEVEDALSARWPGDSMIFCNPPYARKTKDYPGISGWLGLGYSAAWRGSSVMFVLPASTGTDWFGSFAPDANVALLWPRVAFEDENGERQGSPPHGTALITFTPETVRDGGRIQVMRMSDVGRTTRSATGAGREIG